MPVEESELLALKDILAVFASSTGLGVNYEKSFIVPVNVSDGRMSELAQALGCHVGSMPFTYLGLPLGLTKPVVYEFMPVLTRVERHLMGISRMLTYAGRLVLVNSIYTALPTFFMCSLKIPLEVLDQLEKYSKHCLWNERDLTKKKRRLSGGMEECLSK